MCLGELNIEVWQRVLRVQLNESNPTPRSVFGAAGVSRFDPLDGLMNRETRAQKERTSNTSLCLSYLSLNHLLVLHTQTKVAAEYNGWVRRKWPAWHV